MSGVTHFDETDDRSADPTVRRGRPAVLIIVGIGLVAAVVGAALSVVGQGADGSLREAHIEVGFGAGGPGDAECRGRGRCPDDGDARSGTIQVSVDGDVLVDGENERQPGRSERGRGMALGQNGRPGTDDGTTSSTIAEPTTTTAGSGGDEPSTTATSTTTATSGSTGDEPDPPTSDPTSSTSSRSTSSSTTSSPSTTSRSSTTAAPTTTTTRPAGDGGCCGEGRAGILVNARSPFDEWSSGGHWDFFNANYDQMIVFQPYWDSRLQHYDDTLVYKNAYAIYVSTSRDRRAVDHPDWVLREADGTPVYIDWGCSDGCPQYAADVSNPDYQEDFLRALAGLQRTGYRGVLLDDVNMTWRFSDQYGDSDVTPIDPNTGQPLTVEVWRRHLADFLDTVRDRFPDLVIAHNAIWYSDSPSFDDPSIDRQIAAADFIELERGATDGGLVAGTSKYGFQTFLRYIDRVHSLGGNVVLLDETAETDEGLWFNLAATLLVNDGGDLVSTENWDAISPDGFWSGFRTDLGDALGRRYLDGGLIRRDFTGGIVLLNEPGRSSVRVTLSQPMRLPSGQMVDEIVVDGREAVVLHRS